MAVVAVTVDPGRGQAHGSLISEGVRAAGGPESSRHSGLDEAVVVILAIFTTHTWNTAEHNAERLETIQLTIAGLSEKLAERTGKPAEDYRADIEAKARKRNKRDR